MQHNNPERNITKEAAALLGRLADSPARLAIAELIGPGGTITKADVQRVFVAYRYTQEWEYWKAAVLAADIVEAADRAFLDGVRLGRLMSCDASTVAITDWIKFLDAVYGDDEPWWEIENHDEDDDDDF